MSLSFIIFWVSAQHYLMFSSQWEDDKKCMVLSMTILSTRLDFMVFQTSHMKNRRHLILTTWLIATLSNQAEKLMIELQALWFLIRYKIYMTFLTKNMKLCWQRGTLNISKDSSMPFSEIIWSYQLNLSILSSRHTAKS